MFFSTAVIVVQIIEDSVARSWGGYSASCIEKKKFAITKFSYTKSRDFPYTFGLELVICYI
jgi:hypothetical protein